MAAIARRLIQLVAVLVMVSAFCAVLLEFLPGDPVTTMVPFGDENQRERIREELNLNDPLPVRYVQWLGDFVTGDLGNYYRGPTVIDPVSEDVRHALPVSLLLMFYAQVLTLAISIPAGIFMAYRAGSKSDRTANAAVFAAISVPNFVLASFLIYYGAVRYGWFPASGYVEAGEDFGEHVRHMILPAMSLAVGQIAVYTRLLRSDMISTLQEDFILMAKSKGIPNRRILWRHALRPSSLTLLTAAGLNVGTLIGGSVLIEKIFQLPGMGKLVFDAISGRQYVALQSLVAIIAIIYVLVNFFVDFLYSILDPRIRRSQVGVS